MKIFSTLTMITKSSPLNYVIYELIRTIFQLDLISNIFNQYQNKEGEICTKMFSLILNEIKKNSILTKNFQILFVK